MSGDIRAMQHMFMVRQGVHRKREKFLAEPFERGPIGRDAIRRDLNAE
jgi:hypothetical protein